jgi:hypothetical protein
MLRHTQQPIDTGVSYFSIGVIKSEYNREQTKRYSPLTIVTCYHFQAGSTTVHGVILVVEGEMFHL